MNYPQPTSHIGRVGMLTLGLISGLIIGCLPSAILYAWVDPSWGSPDIERLKLNDAQDALQKTAGRMRSTSAVPRRTDGDESSASDFWDPKGLHREDWYVVVPVVSHGEDGRVELYAISDFIGYPTLRATFDPATGTDEIIVERIGPYARVNPDD